MKTNALNASAELHSDPRPLAAVMWMKGVVGQLRRASSDRALRRQLAELDDSLLRDIGIGEDEIWRVRSLHSFTPRAWY